MLILRQTLRLFILVENLINECAVVVNAGKRSLKALWDSGAGRCVISYECYNKISPKFKSDLFTSDIRLKAANSTFIRNKGECEISFKIGQETFRFPFLCSDQLSKELILGHNFAQSFHIGTLWNANDVMSLTRNGKPFADTLHTNYIKALVFSKESIVIPPFSNAFIKCCIIFYQLTSIRVRSLLNTIVKVWVIIHTHVWYCIRKFLYFL